MIILAATPIGNLGDASPRLVEALEHGDGHRRRGHPHDAAPAAGARRRRTGRGSIALHEHNETEQGRRAGRARARAGRARAERCRDADRQRPRVRRWSRRPRPPACTVTAIPGPVAVLDRARRVGPAHRPVLLRGVPAAQGRGPRRALPRSRGEPRTMVFFESPDRLAASLADMADGVRRGSARGRVPRAHQAVRGGRARHRRRTRGVGRRRGAGEICIVVEGAAPATESTCRRDRAGARARGGRHPAEGCRRRGRRSDRAGQARPVRGCAALEPARASDCTWRRRAARRARARRAPTMRPFSIDAAVAKRVIDERTASSSPGQGVPHPRRIGLESMA